MVEAVGGRERRRGGKKIVQISEHMCVDRIIAPSFSFYFFFVGKSNGVKTRVQPEKYPSWERLMTSKIIIYITTAIREAKFC